MRIAIDARYLNESYSGIAKYSENLLAHLSRVDQENEYTVFIHPGYNRRLKVGDNFKVVQYRGRPISLRTALTFGGRLHRNGFDFLHSLHPFAPLYGIRQAILTIHDLQPFAIQEALHTRKAPSVSQLASLFFRIAFPHFIRSATWLITVSQATKDHLVSLFPEAEHKTLVIHSGVENMFLNPPEQTIEQMVAKRLALPPNYLLYIGSAQPNKNLPSMIRAFSRFRQSHPDAPPNLQFIMVVKKDRHFSSCQKLIKSLKLRDCVRVIGPITEQEKHVLYSKAKCLFSVTRGEGFGFPIVEAQASGLPVLASNDASIPEVAGEGAMLVNPDNWVDMAAGLEEVLLNEATRNRLIDSGKKNVERFSWDKTAEKVHEIYRLLM